MKSIQEARENSGVRTGIITPARRLEKLTGEGGKINRCEQKGIRFPCFRLISMTYAGIWMSPTVWLIKLDKVYPVGYILGMIEIRQTDYFIKWIRGLRDIRARARVQARIDRLADGNPRGCETNWGGSIGNAY